MAEVPPGPDALSASRTHVNSIAVCVKAVGGQDGHDRGCGRGGGGGGGPTAPEEEGQQNTIDGSDLKPNQCKLPPQAQLLNGLIHCPVNGLQHSNLEPGPAAPEPAEPALIPTDPSLIPAEPALIPAEPALIPADPALIPADPALIPADPEAPKPADSSVRGAAEDCDFITEECQGQAGVSLLNDNVIHSRNCHDHHPHHQGHSSRPLEQNHLLHSHNNGMPNMPTTMGMTEVDEEMRRLDIGSNLGQEEEEEEDVEEDCSIQYVRYESELQMPDIIRLITKDLSEPYSIYTYRYFIHNWPQLCFLAMVEEDCVGAIVCKLDMHKKMFRRGYIAMLAVDSRYRRKGIGTNLVKRAIYAMMDGDCDEVVLETEITNRSALKLYANLGFVRDKRLFRYYLNGVDALRLKLWLR